VLWALSYSISASRLLFSSMHFCIYSCLSVCSWSCLQLVWNYSFEKSKDILMCSMFWSIACESFSSYLAASIYLTIAYSFYSKF
jgi:hypothetical protein